jgi:hypothetical protein
VDLIRRPQSISMLVHRRPTGHNDRGSCKRLKDILDQIVADLGGADMISEGQRRLCRRAATLSIQAEAMECDAFGNQPFDIELYGQLCDRLRRYLQRFGLKRVARDTQNLRQYLATPAKPPVERCQLVLLSQGHRRPQC